MDDHWKGEMPTAHPNYPEQPHDITLHFVVSVD